MFKLYKHFYIISFLILNFSFCNYINSVENDFTDLETKEASILISNFCKYMILDSWSYLINSNKIESIAHSDSSVISGNAGSSTLSNLFFILRSPIYVINSINQYKLVHQKKAHPVMAITEGLDLLPLAMEYQFLLKNKEIIKNSKKIAKYNNLSKKDGFKHRLIQRSWLMANKVLPYAGLLYSKYINHQTLDKSLSTKDFNLWPVLRCFSSFSETVRKCYLYKNIMGDYKKYKELKEKKLQKINFLQNQINQIS